jgi:hypothetical protein
MFSTLSLQVAPDIITLVHAAVACCMCSFYCAAAGIALASPAAAETLAEAFVYNENVSHYQLAYIAVFYNLVNHL